MATNFIQSVKLLPEFLQTDKNTKFLASTIDQLIQKPQLERLDGYIGSTNTPTYTTSDVYISEISNLRTDYQLTPSLVIQDELKNISSVVAIDDLVNEINLYNGNTTNFDRLFRSKFYAYDPKIDWDKLVNYQDYFWLVNGPDPISLVNVGSVLNNIVGQQTYTINGITLSNGMIVSFDNTVEPQYQNKEFFVEGVGSSIVLVDTLLLNGTESVNQDYTDPFGINPFDYYPFDGTIKLPLTPNYITINRASQDLNPWTRNNRWVHKDVIAAAAAASNEIPVYPADSQAQRPIIEFAANLKLYNFGTIGIPNVDFVDTTVTDAFNQISGAITTATISGVSLAPGTAKGKTVIFLSDSNPAVASTIYQIGYATIQSQLRLTLSPLESPVEGSSIAVNSGMYEGSSWWYNGTTWIYAQQYTTNNQAPLFDLFDDAGHSYSDPNYYSTNFTGNQIFGYGVGTGTPDSVLGFPLQYRNNLDLSAAYLFQNYFMNGTINVIEEEETTTISTGITYFKIGENYFNVWTEAADYPVPVITSNLTSSTYYDLPLGLTNNPLNGPIESFTISDLTNHVATMADNAPNFNGVVPGDSNLRDIGDVSIYGHRLISNINPMPYAHLFIGTKENSVVDALTKAADQYNYFKMGFLRQIASNTVSTTSDPVTAVDAALLAMNANRTSASAYYLSDMVPYGTDYISRTWTVINSNNTIYPLSSSYDPTQLTLRAVLVYVNGTQLIRDQDYEFVENDAYVQFLITLNVGDVIVINDYTNTEGNYIPSTPTKLGMYPKFTPSIFVDNTYVTPRTVIQGHDGSIMTAYNDYRDAIILELEKRIYNNIKAEYRPELLDINAPLPGAFRTGLYSIDEINPIIQQDFIKWANQYGVDYTDNTTFNQNNYFTWNYTGGYNNDTGTTLFGSWRAIYKYFYDTDRPHTNPWEMLGFSEEPSWWVEQYGPAPYTATNLEMWTDLQNGVIQQGELAGTNALYARPGLLNLIPVDPSGNLIDPISLGLALNITPLTNNQPWKFGDLGPSETAWRRSSYWPFVVQKMLALTQPATYCALMYDPINITKNIAGQYTYGPNHQFLQLANMPIQGLNNTLTSGYSLYVSEIGKQRSGTYAQDLYNSLTNLNVNLFYKVGGFFNSSELQIIIDAVDPTSSNPGSILEPEDYSLILNVSNPIQSTAISGIIIQKNNGKLLVKGYDTQNPYFNVYNCLRNSQTPTVTVGGVSSPFVNWQPSFSGGDTGLTTEQTTSAQSAVSGNFYQQGQIVLYSGKYYIVKISHRSGSTFDSAYFQQIPSLPISGGATVQTAESFDKSKIIQIPYGTEFDTIQQVYDLIIGYGAWLEDQGFSFTEFNANLNTVLNWDFTSREFLYWTTQNWADQSVIALSPFANQIVFQLPNSVVDNIFDSFYQYSLLQPNGVPFPQDQLSVTRNNGVCTIQTLNSFNGIYFARLNSVQKEHAIVFNNSTIFNDTVYDIESGYRQERMKLVGFRTANWNGDYFSPGFIYDQATINTWKQYTDYNAGDVVYYTGNYYAAINNIDGSATFDFTKWNKLGKKPVAQLLPNFDYQISQFEDFYSLNIDNFDSSVQQAAQNLTGYTPRTYLNNIFTDPIAQYKFYQGFIKEKGTKNAISKLARASLTTLQSEIDYNEEWAFRVGYYGSYSSYNEIEVSLQEGSFLDNPQTISFVNEVPSNAPQLINFVLPNDLAIVPKNYQPISTFITTSSTDLFQLEVAGYPRLDDVDLTSFNQDGLLNFTSTNSIIRGNTVWIANTPANDWDVLRYTLSPARLVSVSADTVVSDQYNFLTNSLHNLSVGQLVSIVEFDPAINGIYQVNSVPSPTQFTIINSGTVTISNTSPSGLGLLFVFDSTRYDSFDDLPADNILLGLRKNSIVWTDDDGTGNWAVYQKIKNYDDNITQQTSNNEAQNLGWSISKKGNSNIFLVGAPGYQDSYNSGNVFVYLENDGSSTLQFNYGLDRSYANSYQSGFGQSVFYDESYSTSSYGLMFAGAPLASNVRWSNTGSVSVVTTSSNASSNSQEGLVKISSINPNFINEQPQLVIASPNPTSNEQFGSSLYAAGFSTGRLLLVGAPQLINAGTGNVYSYWISTITNSISGNISYVGQVTTSTIGASNTGSFWGKAIAGTANAEYIAIGAPGYFTGTGLVTIFTGTSTAYFQTIYSPFGKTGNFGQAISFSDSGNYLFVSAPNVRNVNQSYGNVAAYSNQNEAGYYTLTQIISNPVSGIGMRFGQAIGINSNADELTITALGTNKHIINTFDVYSSPLANSETLFNTPYVNDSNSKEADKNTTFDLDSTTFFDTVIYSGTAYVYDKQQNLFKLGEELVPLDTNTGTNFGYSIAVNDSSIYIGAPAYANEISPDDATSSFTQYYKINQSALSWNLLRYQDNLVDVNTIQKVTLFDTFNDDVLNYLEVIDPLKGKIAGLADQELKYKTAFDPAIYSVGSSSTVNNLNTNWQDTHVGELWWDLSTAKYVWYEQGELQYRRNNWGSLFPGSSVDVYEWVETTLLPSQWAAQADTDAGLAAGISGQPKYPDNSVLSVKQVYNKISGNFTNYYYYWVKNSTIIPNVSNRRLSCNSVIQIITDPKSYGLQYVDILSSNAVAVANVGNLLVNDRIDLNIASDVINNPIPRHTEWLLLQENNENSVPNSLLEKKLFDSLIGHDSVGNSVPDPALSQRQAYGIEIRPRQSMFKDRITALRNLIEFTNGILINKRIVGSYSFENLNKQELPPNQYSNSYDQIVEDDDALRLLELSLSLPTNVDSIITCTVNTYTGSIQSVDIVSPGTIKYGDLNPIYSSTGTIIAYQGPTVTIYTNGTNVDTSGAVISTQVDITGALITATIVNPGSGFVIAPTLSVRPYTVIVQSDSTSNGKWAQYSYINSNWIKIHTQLYNTTLYWNYVDWISPNYKSNVDYVATVGDLYELNELTSLSTGTYVKVNNAGLGNYAIVEQVASGELGDFNNNFNIVYSQNGTIQISNDVWDIPNSNFGFDEVSAWDQTLYDQLPDLELQYILQAIKNDLFINNLKVNWNLFFFTAVKYALSEQKQLDWAFKTSFINAVLNAGELNQPPVYKLLDDTNFQDYISEVKPYHTQIREFTTEYTTLDPSQSYTTDFDLPAYYDSSSETFNTVQLGNSLLNEYPWKSWADNYRYQIGSIEVVDSGEGYAIAPTVVISDPNGSGATAVAYLSRGTVSKVEITNPGTGYINPTITLIGTCTSTATAYPYIINELVRSPTIGMKFDRISSTATVKTLTAFDSFIANGQEAEFPLSWTAVPDKTIITVINSSTQVLPSDYTIVYDDSPKGLYNYGTACRLVFLNYIPQQGNLITISYKKNINVLDATDRILNYYEPTAGMFGLDLAQLMSGIEYPGTLLTGNTSTVNFNTITNYDTLLNTNTATSGFTVAIGTGSADIIIDGDGFITPNTSYGPEELIPGQVKESVGINVYINTGTIGSPIIVSGSVDVFASTNTYTTQELSIVPPDIASIVVSFNGTIFTYRSDTQFTAPTQYNIDWATNQIIIPPQTTSGKLAYKIVSEGGPATQYQAGYLDYASVTTSTISGASVEVQAPNTSFTVNSAFVTLNGSPVPSTYSNSPYYTLINGIVTVYNLPLGLNTITAWFFGSEYQTFNEINEQTYTISEVFYGNSVNALTSYTVVPAPNYVKPEVANVLVEFYNGVTGGTRLLTPPHIDYYQVTSSNINNPVFLINNNNRDGTTCTFNINNVSVYVNGTQLRPSFDYTVSYNAASYVTITKSLSVGNVIAIKSLPGLLANQNGNSYSTAQQQNYEYDIIGNTLYLSTPVVPLGSLVPGQTYTIAYGNPSNFVSAGAPNNSSLSYGTTFVATSAGTSDGVSTAIVTANASWNPYVYGELRIITYTDQDDMLMETQTFYGNNTGRYQVSRPVLNENYIWVSVNGVPIVNFVDFIVLPDQITVQLSDKFVLFNTDVVEIITFNSVGTVAQVLGYRIFEDFNYKTTFTRLDNQNPIYLTQPLYSTSTQIYLNDVSALTPPNVAANVPGVVLVAGELIEFFTVDYANNILGQLRRSTVGTGPKTVCEAGTIVFDQGSLQIIPNYSETILSQSTLTTTSTCYTISTASSVLYYTTGTVNGHPGLVTTTTTATSLITFNNKGILLTATNSLGTKFNAVNQVSVYYGGTLLNKHGTYYQDINTSYETPAINFNTSTSAGLNCVNFVENLATTTNIGTAYIVNSKLVLVTTATVLTSATFNTSTITLSGNSLSSIYTGTYIIAASGVAFGTTVTNFSTVTNKITLSTGTIGTGLYSLPAGTVIGFYTSATSNQVWVYENSTALDSVNGYVYSGVTYIPPQFTITTATQQINLNFTPIPGVQLTVLKKQLSTSTWWNYGSTMFMSQTQQAEFLQNGLSVLPTDYYYGGGVP